MRIDAQKSKKSKLHAIYQVLERRKSIAESRKSEQLKNYLSHTSNDWVYTFPENSRENKSGDYV
jgi:hypothetical protein